jgi:adenylate cyclase
MAHSLDHSIELRSFGERIDILLAGLRVLILFVLGGTFYFLGVLAREPTLGLSLGGLAVTTGLSLYAAIFRVRAKWVPWVFTTLDVGFLVHCLALFTARLGLPLGAALVAPGAWLIFLYLIMGVLSLSPGLVLYAGILFIAGWMLVTFFPTSLSDEKNLVHAADHLMQGGSAAQLVQIAILAVSTLALAVCAWHSRRALLDAVREASARQQLSRHFARPILDKLLAAPPSGARLENARASVMFVDVCGFTRFAERTGPEHIAAFLSAFRARILEVVAHHDGIVDKFIGDGVLIVFGVPQSRRDDAARAIRCALDLRQALEDWRGTDALASQVHFGIGLHWGDVVVGLIGNDDRVEFAVLGDTVNVAARLQQLANAVPGDTLASIEVITAAGLTPDACGEPLPPQSIRGREGAIRPIRLNSSALTREHGIFSAYRG